MRERDTSVRSGERGQQAPQAGNWAAAPWPPQPPPPRAAVPAPARPAVAPGPRGRAASAAAAAEARRERGMIGVVPYLAVLLCTAVGVYIAWRDGSAGAATGGVVAGGALIAAGMVRLVLPDRLAGLLVSRRRAMDVLMLTAFGACLLIAGLVLPRLGLRAAIRTRENGGPADEREPRITCRKSRWPIPSSN